MTMIKKMCEDIPADKMPEIVAINRDPVEGEVLTVNFLHNDEDVEAIKSRLKEIPGVGVEHFSSSDNEDSEKDSFDVNCDSDISSERYPSVDENSVNCRSDPSEKADSLCQSTETLIDHLDSSASAHSLELNMSRTRNFSGPSTSESHGNVNNAVTVATTKSVTSGLLISPTSLAPLTQDVHVQMGDDSKRMSTVLESLDLHLVYIPKTQQLVNAKTHQAVTAKTGAEKVAVENGTSDKVDRTDAESVSSGSLSATSSSQKSSPMKMATSSSSAALQILNPGGLDDSSSICETDFLIRVQEPDQITCDSSDFDNFPSRFNNHTNDSLLRTFTDASSLSSLSTGTDFSVSAASLDEGDGTGHCIDTGDGGFMEINLHTRNSFERNKNPSQDSGFEDKSNKPKRKGLTSFLSRNLFSRKSKESTSSDGENSQPGWKLFGKVPLKQVPVKDPNQIQVEFKDKQREELLVAHRSKKEDIEVMSTTALILENRPMNLPNKDPEEMERHQKEYEAMVEAARRKEQRELKLKKKHKQQQLKLEEQQMAASRVWTRDILPNWDTMRLSKKARDLWWHGIPTNVRGKVWKLAIGNDLNVTHELYEICVSRAADRIRQMDDSPEIFGTSETSSEPPSCKESSVELIKLDVSRTFPQLCIFQKGGPYHDLLHSLLGAYACYRPDVGYVQGMSFIAAVLLLNMDVANAFISFANLLNHPCQVAFFRLDESLIKMYFQTYEEFFRENLPTLHLHFTKNSLTPDLYLYDWIFTLFSKSLPLDVACRVWDIFCRDGEEFLFRTALGILSVHEELLMTLDFIHLAQFLTRLPEGDWYDNLFRSTDAIQMNVDKKTFSKVLAMKRDCKDNT